MSEFKVGDRVRVLSALTWEDFRSIGIYGRIDECIGMVDTVECEEWGGYHLRNARRWFPGSMLELADEGKKLDPDPDRYVITLERFDMDGKKYMSGSADICESEFYGMWDCYIA